MCGRKFPSCLPVGGPSHAAHCTGHSANPAGQFSRAAARSHPRRGLQLLPGGRGSGGSPADRSGPAPTRLVHRWRPQGGSPQRRSASPRSGPHVYSGVISNVPEVTSPAGSPWRFAGVPLNSGAPSVQLSSRCPRPAASANSGQVPANACPSGVGSAHPGPSGWGPASSSLSFQPATRDSP